ncbi:hypothetical protein SELMODRAFT_431605 [Selaginella moellendorffii]|uniref:Uncharacterized protein n=1 Tax=Selaginella moellendorffii TaxID=88036 RepID=D8TD68_SELML|nr:hypothetical protein SELMODRAFT_431605 [Selaginella moellendorffii]
MELGSHRNLLSWTPSMELRMFCLLILSQHILEKQVLPEQHPDQCIQLKIFMLNEPALEAHFSTDVPRPLLCANELSNADSSLQDAIHEALLLSQAFTFFICEGIFYKLFYKSFYKKWGSRYFHKGVMIFHHTSGVTLVAFLPLLSLPRFKRDRIHLRDTLRFVPQALVCINVTFALHYTSLLFFLDWLQGETV